MKKLDLNELDLNKETFKNVEGVTDEGQWNSNLKIECWNNKIELPTHSDYEHRYFIVWDNDDTTCFLRRCKR